MEVKRKGGSCNLFPMRFIFLVCHHGIVTVIIHHLAHDKRWAPTFAAECMKIFFLNSGGKFYFINFELHSLEMEMLEECCILVWEQKTFVLF